MSDSSERGGGWRAAAVVEAAGAAVQRARVRAPLPPPPRPHSPLSSGDMAFEGDPLVLAGGNGVAAAAGATPPRMPLKAAAKALYHLAAAFAAKGPLSALAAHLLSLPPLGVPPTLAAPAADLRAAGATTSEVAAAAGGVGATLGGLLVRGDLGILGVNGDVIAAMRERERAPPAAEARGPIP